MKSIKSKVALVFSLAFFIMLVSLILVNHFLNDDFYISANKKNMIDAAMTFEKIVNEEGARTAVENIEKTSGAMIFIFDKENRILPGALTNEPWRGFTIADIERLKKSAESNKEFYFEVIGKPEMDDCQLVLCKKLKHGDILLLTKKMGIAREASSLNFHFMMLSSGFIYCIALIIIFIISSKFCKPVIEMKKKTEKMSQLDFSEKIDILSIDEIGILSGSINKLSDKLSKTINQLNDTNNKLNIELEKEKKLEKMRRRFVSDVSHELKNPISIIQGYADGLVHGIPKTAEDKAYYHRIIVEESMKMNRLIKDLLDLSSYESGCFTLNKENVDLTQIVKSNLEKFNQQINNQSVNIRFESARQYMVFGDGLRLGQVVINLLTNALKYVNEKGTIIIKFSEVEDKVRLVIANTGDLIQQKELDQIWNSFYQVDNTKKGNGLGLAIIKSIVSLHEGSCRAYIDGDFNCFEIII